MTKHLHPFTYNVPKSNLKNRFLNNREFWKHRSMVNTGFHQFQTRQDFMRESNTPKQYRREGRTFAPIHMQDIIQRCIRRLTFSVQNFRPLEGSPPMSAFDWLIAKFLPAGSISAGFVRMIKPSAVCAKKPTMLNRFFSLRRYLSSARTTLPSNGSKSSVPIPACGATEGYSLVRLGRLLSARHVRQTYELC
jgi:hypothetical protein